MHKLFPAVLLTLFLQSCSSIPFLRSTPLTTATSGPTATETASATPSVTPTDTITPTITPSATVVHIPTQDPNLPTNTFVPIPIFIGRETATPATPPTPIKPGPGFESVTVSDPKIFWGNCIPFRTTVTARVEDPAAVISVVIFVQVKSAKRDDSTPWTSGDVMFNHGGGLFSAVLTANDIDGHNNYKDSWVRYQLVATDKNGKEIGRTKIYPESIALSPCMCFEPLKGCPIDTPRAKP